MTLPLLLAAAIALTLTLIVIVMYLGGGAEVVRRQLGTLILIGGALAAVATAITLVSGRRELLVIGTLVAAAATASAIILGRSSQTAARGDTSMSGTPFFVLAAAFAVLTLVGIALVIARS